jgi:hypothetical protein
MFITVLQKRWNQNTITCRFCSIPEEILLDDTHIVQQYIFLLFFWNHCHKPKRLHVVCYCVDVRRGFFADKTITLILRVWWGWELLYQSCIKNSETDCSMVCGWVCISFYLYGNSVCVQYVSSSLILQKHYMLNALRSTTHTCMCWFVQRASFERLTSCLKTLFFL